MSREKQNDEMAKIASKCMTKWLNNETPKALPDYIAEAFYNAGYRKQSEGEWINITRIHERLGIEVPQRWKCSCCDYLEYHGPTKYCGGCGAKMKGGGE